VKFKLFCSQTATPSPTLVVDRLAAISSGAHFCLDTNGSTFGLGQPFNDTQEEYDTIGYYERWADTDDCKDQTLTYTIDEHKCASYINMTVDGCDPPAPDNKNTKHGGTVTDGCMIFEMKPRIVQGEPVPTESAPPPPPPAPTKPCPVISSPIR